MQGLKDITESAAKIAVVPRASSEIRDTEKLYETIPDLNLYALKM
jgi:hypothetical protein